jgi:hypothetical protein
MSEYARRFAENDIDFTILGDLTDQDFEKIGVVALGHRRKLLRAIADLKKSEPIYSREELHERPRKRNERDRVRSIVLQVPKRFPILPIKF